MLRIARCQIGNKDSDPRQLIQKPTRIMRNGSPVCSLGISVAS